MDMNFCRRCGKPLTHIKDHLYQCTDGHTIYGNQSPAVGVFFVSSDCQRVLLTVRGIDPGKGMLGAPGGFLDAKETFEEAIAREVREEISLDPVDYGNLSYLTSQYDGYAYKEESLPVITVLFWAMLENEDKLKSADEVQAVSWHPLASVDFEQVHAADVRGGLRTLQKLLEDS